MRLYDAVCRNADKALVEVSERLRETLDCKARNLQ